MANSMKNVPIQMFFQFVSLFIKCESLPIQYCCYSLLWTAFLYAFNVSSATHLTRPKKKRKNDQNFLENWMNWTKRKHITHLACNLFHYFFASILWQHKLKQLLGFKFLNCKWYHDSMATYRLNSFKLFTSSLD